ncbi:MAG TPA: 2Fe-2S iron-sulfur cluster-binding protein [Candidatus Cybelea sp.]|nr:2Fe-2S iron-sulfur cluster-binding protein [Candidatus Cybelea sp.]
MPFRVKVRQLPEPLQVAEGQTILDAALSAGHDYPCGCQSGNCGACKSVLISGDVEMAPYSDYALTAEEKASGLVLACRSMPWSDVEIAWLEPDEVAAHPLRKLVCRVASIDAVTHDIRRVRLAIESGGPFSFSAGQYAEVTFDGLPARDFSMANRPDDAMLEFHIRAVSGGAVSHFVQSGVKVGDKVRVEGPRGVSYLREKHTGPIVAVAGGSGLAPIKSIVERIAALGLRQPVSLYFGVRDERDLYLEDHFRALNASHPNIAFTPVLSEPSGPTSRRKGFLSDVLAQDFADLDGAKAYLAGPPIMVETCVSALRKLGVRKEDCHADAFYTEADKARLAAS